MAMSEYEQGIDRKRMPIGGGDRVKKANTDVRTGSERKFIRRQIDKMRARGRKL